MKNWIKQPVNTNICGQIAVAVIADIPLKQSIEVVGRKGCTTTKQIVNALRKLGYDCPDRLKRKPKPEFGIGKLTYPCQNKGHWVVIDSDKIYDGLYGNSDGIVKWKSEWRITSYLPVTKN